LVPDKPILITGASGLLGANLTMEFLRQGRRVVPIYHTHPIVVTGATSAACDLTNTAEIERSLSEWAPSLVIHCAAATNVDWCESHPQEAMRINAQLAGDLAAQARSVGARLVFVSTDAVFDGISGGYAETDAVRPQNWYARSKVAGEEAVLRTMAEALVLRVNIYGWNLQAKNSLAEWVLLRLEHGDPVPGFCDTMFSPVLANDLAEWIPRLVDFGCSGVYHAGSADHTSKYDFAQEIANVFQLDVALVKETLLEASGLSAPRPRNTWLRADKITQVLGQPMPTIRQGLERFRTLRDNGFFHRLKAAGSTTTRSGAECQP
jgi:dTDP-4-dehydrorhamnose reductase